MFQLMIRRVTPCNGIDIGMAPPAIAPTSAQMKSRGRAMTIRTRNALRKVDDSAFILETVVG